ncbi:MAG: hypothetical protein M1834_008495 [Cirrosporium novae-zelandiae]|nr:MAG: hypothetical protein M1834_008495 [Cirrosporium novae-zelandiae]
MALVIIPTLVPLNYIGGKGAADGIYGLDQLSWANVGYKHTVRYWGHFISALAVVVYVCYTVCGELRAYTRIRQAYLIPSVQRHQTFAATILVTKIPKELLTVKALSNLYNKFPGGIRDIWINRDLRNLLEKIDERAEVIYKLERAETKFIQDALLNSSSEKRSIDNDDDHHHWRGNYLEHDQKRFSLSILREKTDQIDNYRKKLDRLNAEIEEMQKEAEQLPLVDSAFVQFNDHLAAHMACRSVVDYRPQTMLAECVGVSPQNIVWKSLTMSQLERQIRTILVTLVIAALIIGWTGPVALTGLISQISDMIAVIPWLDWLNHLPTGVLGFIQGYFPQILLAGVMSLVPVLLRFLANQQGLYTQPAIELSLQNYYFIFLFIQVFLTVSLSSGIATTIADFVQDIYTVPNVLATNLPKASNYFFSYLMLHAFSMGAAALIQAGNLFRWFVIAPFCDKTARQKAMRLIHLPTIQEGTFLPVYTNLACIGIIYAVIAPLILIFDVLVFIIFLAVYRHNMLRVTVFQADTSGLLYPRALMQLFTGIYVMELCLIGLFFLVRDSDGNIVCIGQASLMIFATLSTMLFHMKLRKIYKPLLKLLPLRVEEINQVEKKSENATRPDNHLKRYQSFRPDCMNAKKPIVWIPRDSSGISDHEIMETRKLSQELSISNEQALIDENGKITLTGLPPDFFNDSWQPFLVIPDRRGTQSLTTLACRSQCSERL